jgi:hypothetical protein
MFYNAKGTGEQIYAATSIDLKTCKPYGSGPAFENLPREPESRRDQRRSANCPHKDVWVMLYFGAFWKPGAFNNLRGVL